MIGSRLPYLPIDGSAAGVGTLIGGTVIDGIGLGLGIVIDGIGVGLGIVIDGTGVILGNVIEGRVIEGGVAIV